MMCSFLVSPRPNLAEMLALRELRGHPNVVGLLDVLPSQCGRDIYLVFELLPTDLHDAIQSRVLQPVHKEYISYQLLKVLAHAHAVGIMHRDLKPANLLVTVGCELKMADWGLARTTADALDGAGAAGDSATSAALAAMHIDGTLDNDLSAGGCQWREDERRAFTGYVQTRWWRAPEILLLQAANKGLGMAVRAQYTEAIDIFAAGCIIAEMYHGRPLFRGRDAREQLAMLSGAAAALAALEGQRGGLGGIGAAAAVVCAPPPASQQPAAAFELGARSVRVAIAAMPSAARDLVARMLRFDAADRPSAAACLAHPFLRRFAAADGLPTPTPMPPRAPRPTARHSDALAQGALRRLLGCGLGGNRGGTSSPDTSSSSGDSPLASPMSLSEGAMAADGAPTPIGRRWCAPLFATLDHAPKAPIDNYRALLRELVAADCLADGAYRAAVHAAWGLELGALSADGAPTTCTLQRHESLSAATLMSATAAANAVALSRTSSGAVSIASAGGGGGERSGGLYRTQSLSQSSKVPTAASALLRSRSLSSAKAGAAFPARAADGG